MKAFALIKMIDGHPGINNLPCRGYVLAGHIGANWGAYIFSGTAAQLQAINTLPNTYAICAVTESGGIKWAELDGVVSSTVRTRLNTWLTARDYPTIPAGWTYRQIVQAIYKRLNNNWTLEGTDITDG